MVQRDYGTFKCGYCDKEQPQTKGNKKYCDHACQSMAWYDKKLRRGPKPRLIVSEQASERA